MTWLLVLSGNWGFGARREGGVVMRSFLAGLHLDVDEETVSFVRRAGSPQLILGEGEPPEYTRALPPPGEPLRPEHLRIPLDGRIVLAQPEVVEEIFDADPDPNRPSDYPCGHCGARFPHPAPLRRHVERHHGDEELAALAQAASDPEPGPA